MSTFDQFNLDSQLLKAIKQCGYHHPTHVQSKTIPAILTGQDVVACAQTGTGKTAAFILPALQLLLHRKSSPKPRILVLTPTRELATQITEATKRYGQFLKLNIISLVGGMPYRKQLRELSRPIDIIIATPGRLMDHMERRRLDLSQIEMFVLDEADRMLDMGFIDDVRHIASFIPKSHQTLLFSATLDKRIQNIIKEFLKNPVRIDLTTEKITPTEIKQVIYFADHPKQKMHLLTKLIKEENIFKGIIFSATRVHTDRLAQELNEMGFSAAALHGDLKQNVRNKTLELLRRGKIQFLVATDVAGRGLDVLDITHVINYDLPRFAEDYVHRIGRTGRAGKKGIAISLALRNEHRFIKKIESYMGQKISVATMPGFERQQSASSSFNSSQPRKPSRARQQADNKNFRYSDEHRNRKRKFSKDFQPDRRKPFRHDDEFQGKQKFRKEFESDRRKPFRRDEEFQDKRKFRKDFESDRKKPFRQDDEFQGKRKFYNPNDRKEKHSEMQDSHFKFKKKKKFHKKRGRDQRF